MDCDRQKIKLSGIVVLFSIFFGIPRKSSQFVNLMISASFAAFAQATGSAQFYLGSVKSPHNTRGQLFFQEKQNCCIPGKFIVIPKHTEREKRGYLRATQSGDCPLAAKIGPEKSFCPVAFGDRQCENSGGVLLLPTRFRIHLLNYP